MKYPILILLLAIFSLPSGAQDLMSVFLSVPDDVLFGIDAEGKDKLIANPADTAVVSVPSTLNGEVKRLQISDDYIQLQTSGAATLQIKLLPLVNDSKIICVVNTVCGKACDSYVRFYNTNWTPLSNPGMLLPNPGKDWFLKTGIDRSDEEYINAHAALDMIPTKVILYPGNQALTLQCDIKNYLSVGDYKKIEPYIQNLSKNYGWDKISFKPES